MTAVGQETSGSAEVLKLRHLDKPVIGEKDVLVRVRSAGVNVADWPVTDGPARQLKGKTEMSKASVTKLFLGGTTRSQRTIGVRIAALALAVVGLVVPAASPAQAAALTNCVELIGRSGACWESVWANGVQFRMTFPQAAKEFPGAIPSDRVDNFYVIAPQTDTPQGALPFPHDHTVGNVPALNDGSYATRLRGFLVFCSAAGIASGGCAPAAGNLPLARTVNGQVLTSVEAIESAANSGLIALVDTGATFAATITGN